MNTSHFKDLLLKEQERLVEAMQTIGQLSDIVPGHWETHTDTEANKELEPDALADKFEEEATNEGVLDTLETRLQEVNDALVRIEKNSFGKCETCKLSIEPERLEANAAAKTCSNCKS